MVGDPVSAYTKQIIDEGNAQQGKRSIAIMSGKGGVGKTTTTINLGGAMADLGVPVVMIDMDLEAANMTLELGYQQYDEIPIHDFLANGPARQMRDAIGRVRPKLAIIPSTLKQEQTVWEPHQFRTVLDSLDYWTLIDTPPGLNGHQERILQSVDGIIVVFTPSESSFVDGMKLISMAREHGVEVIGAIINRGNESRYDLSISEIQQSLREVGVLGVIPEDKRVRKTRHHSKPLNDIHPHSPAAIAYKAIASGLVNRSYDRPGLVKRIKGRLIG